MGWLNPAVGIVQHRRDEVLKSGQASLKPLQGASVSEIHVDAAVEQDAQRTLPSRGDGVHRSTFGHQVHVEVVQGVNATGHGRFSDINAHVVGGSEVGAPCLWRVAFGRGVFDGLNEARPERFEHAECFPRPPGGWTAALGLLFGPATHVHAHQAVADGLADVWPGRVEAFAGQRIEEGLHVCAVADFSDAEEVTAGGLDLCFAPLEVLEIGHGVQGKLTGIVGRGRSHLLVHDEVEALLGRWGTGAERCVQFCGDVATGDVEAGGLQGFTHFGFLFGRPPLRMRFSEGFDRLVHAFGGSGNSRFSYLTRLSSRGVRDGDGQASATVPAEGALDRAPGATLHFQHAGNPCLEGLLGARNRQFQGLGQGVKVFFGAFVEGIHRQRLCVVVQVKVQPLATGSNGSGLLDAKGAKDIAHLVVFELGDAVFRQVPLIEHKFTDEAGSEQIHAT